MKTGMLALAAVLLASLPALAQIPAGAEEVIRLLGLTNIRLHPDERGPDATGTLPGGVLVELDFYRDGTLEEIETDGRALAPFAALAPVLPEALQKDEKLAGSTIEQLEFDNDGIEIEGRDRDGNRFKAEYTASGELREWKRD